MPLGTIAHSLGITVLKNNVVAWPSVFTCLTGGNWDWRNIASQWSTSESLAEMRFEWGTSAFIAFKQLCHSQKECIGKDPWHKLSDLDHTNAVCFSRSLQSSTLCSFLGSTVVPSASFLSQQRNLVLFRAFCAMKYAIYALCVNAHKHANCKDCVSCFANELLHQNESADQLLYPGLVIYA